MYIPSLRPDPKGKACETTGCLRNHANAGVWAGRTLAWYVFVAQVGQAIYNVPGGAYLRQAALQAVRANGSYNCGRARHTCNLAISVWRRLLLSMSGQFLLLLCYVFGGRH